MPNTIVQPYLTFGGRCEEAIEFYKKTIDAKVEMLICFKESPEPPPAGTVQNGFDDKVMHACIRIGGSAIMASDGFSEGSAFEGFSLSISVETEDEADRFFNALADGGKIEVPLDKAFWSPRFGMLTDRFGVGWMVNVAMETPQ